MTAKLPSPNSWENSFIPPGTPLTTDALLTAAAERTPEQIALKENQLTRTYKQLNMNTLSLAEGLYNQGVQKGQIVLLNLPIGICLFESFLAVTRMGAVALHLHDFFKQHEVDALLDRIRPSFCLGSAWHKTELPMINPEDLIAKSPPVPIRQPPTEEDRATLITTSGTTGCPKLIDVSHLRLYRRVPTPRIHFQPGFRYGCPYPHTLPVYHLALALFSGGEIHFRPVTAPLQIEKFISEERLNYFWGLPALYEQVAQIESTPTPDLSSFKGAVTTSAYLSATTMRRVEQRWAAPIYQFYGQNEFGNLAFSDPNTPKESVGTPAPGVALRIVDKTGHNLPVGQIGNIQIKTTAGFGGYATGEPAPIDSQGWFTTGDVGYLDHSGFLYLLGRENDLINVGGFKVSANEVREILKSMSGIKDAHVFPQKNPVRGEVVAAAVVADPGITRALIKQYCKPLLPRFKQPVKIYILSQLPKNTLGKIDRGKLAEVIENIRP